MFLGFVSALVRRKQLELGGAAPVTPGPTPVTAPDPAYLRRVDELASAVAALQKRVDTRAETGLKSAAAPPSEEMAGRLEAVSERIERLERRVEQLASEASAAPAVDTDQVLAAVEQMITQRIGGLDERLTDQVRAIELLRSASAQTDTLLQKLICAVEVLAEQAGEKLAKSASAAEGNAEGALGAGPPRDYPFA